MDSSINLEERSYTSKMIPVTSGAHRDKWEQKNNFEYLDVCIDLRAYDPDGTLKLDSRVNRKYNKLEPMFVFNKGKLYLRLKRDI